MVQKYGSSQVIRLDKEDRQILGVDLGDTVYVSKENPNEKKEPIE